MFVERDIVQGQRGRKGDQFARQLGQILVDLFRMDLRELQEMVQQREVPVDRVEQPERGDIRGAVLHDALHPLAVGRGESLTLDEENGHETPEHGQHRE